MKTKRCGKKNRTKRRYSKSCSKTYSRRCGKKLSQRGGAAVCATGMCSAGLAKMGTVIMSSIGSYKVLSNMRSHNKSKKHKKQNIFRKQRFVYKDNEGKNIYFTIKQKNNKVHIQEGKKKKNKTYSSIKQATKEYDKKLKSCFKKKFKKC